MRVVMVRHLSKARHYVCRSIDVQRHRWWTHSRLSGLTTPLISVCIYLLNACCARLFESLYSSFLFGSRRLVWREKRRMCSMFPAWTFFSLLSALSLTKNRTDKKAGVPCREQMLLSQDLLFVNGPYSLLFSHAICYVLYNIYCIRIYCTSTNIYPYSLESIMM